MQEASFPKKFLDEYRLDDPAAQNLLEPVVDNAKSDTGNLDSAFELMAKAGIKPEEALNRLVPEAYMSNPDPDDQLTAFYEYHGGSQEAWDGPALMILVE